MTPAPFVCPIGVAEFCARRAKAKNVEAAVSGKGSWVGWVALALAVTLVAGCDRDAAPITECIGDQPAIPRIKDVAPPNCSN